MFAIELNSKKVLQLAETVLKKLSDDFFIGLGVSTESEKKDYIIHSLQKHCKEKDYLHAPLLLIGHRQVFIYNLSYLES